MRSCQGRAQEIPATPANPELLVSLGSAGNMSLPAAQHGNRARLSFNHLHCDIILRSKCPHLMAERFHTHTHVCVMTTAKDVVGTGSVQTGQPALAFWLCSPSLLLSLV